MSVLTYKDLYSQVLSLIEESMIYPTSDAYGDRQTSRSQVISGSPFSVAGVGSDLSGVTNTILDLVGSIVPNRIKSGLVVSETDPVSDKVKITAGEGVAKARIYSLNKDVEIEIPFNSTTSVFYINLFINGVEVSTTTSADRLNLAKVIIPDPGTTIKIQDNRDSVTQVNGYIVSLREITLFGNDKGIFDEDSVDVIKDNFREIAAETIIGTLTLDESLKISNVAGTLKLDSNSMKILDSSDNLLAKFNSNGTFFYDSSEREVARFTSSDAKIGNILITKNSIQSDDFVSGSTGFKISDDGNVEFDNAILRGTIYATSGEIAGISITNNSLESSNFVSGSTGFKISDDGNVEFDNAILRGTIYATSGEIAGISITNNSLESSNFVSGALGSGFQLTDEGGLEVNNILARGRISCSVFLKNTISSIGGSLLVMNSDVLNDDMTVSGSTLTIKGDSSFSINDILRIKTSTEDEWLQVTAVNGNTYTVTRDLAGQYAVNSNPTWKKGTCISSYGQSGDGGIFMTSSEPFSPYIDFFTHTGQPWTGTTSKTRIGNLDGIAGAGGYGIVASDGYLGALEVIDVISIGSQGLIRSNLSGNYPYIEMSNTGIQLKTSDIGDSYSTGLYSTAKYGFGADIWIFNKAFGVPWVELKEPKLSGNTVASLRLYNRAANPTGIAELGDLAVVNDKLKICTTAGTPGTWNNITYDAATPALDNLASVAINTSLISDTDNTDDLGSDTKEWKDLYLNGKAYIDGLGRDILVDLGMEIRFGDTAVKISSETDAHLDLEADTSLDLIINGTEQIEVIDGAVLPTINNDINLGSDAVEFKDLWLDGIAYLDTISGVGACNTHLLPTNNTYDLGSDANEWKDIWIDGIAYLDTATITTATITTATITTLGANINFSDYQATNFIIENRTDDTGMTVNGQIWYRTDV